MCIIICDDKNKPIHLNNGLMVKNLFLTHGDERRWKVQTFTFVPYVSGLSW
jgi:hypothetical protein